MRRILLSLLGTLAFTSIQAQYNVNRTLPLGIGMSHFESKSSEYILEKKINTEASSDVIHNYSVHPNPAHIGDNIKVSNLQKGDIIHIFEPEGALVSTQIIDVDQHVNTHELTSGEYLLRTKTLFVKLLIH